MNYDQILIKLGVDATAVKTGLAKISSLVSAWGTTLAADFKSKIGRMFVAGFAFDKVYEAAEKGWDKVKEKILELHRAQSDLPGTSLNFLQGLFNYAERAGTDYEKLSRPLLKFKEVLDAAKIDPNGQEMQMLTRYGIVTNDADLKTQKFSTSIGRLSDAYLKSGKNLKIISDLTGRINNEFPIFLNLLEMGGSKIESLNKFNPFSDLSESSINLYTGLFGAQRTAAQVVAATIGNLVALLGTKAISLTTQNPVATGLVLDLVKKGIELSGQAENAQDDINNKLAQSIEQENKIADAKIRALEATEKQADLQAEIVDRGKDSLEVGAQMARKLLGAKSPMEMFHTITPRMRIERQISDLEQRSKIAWYNGNDKLMGSLQGEAEKIRAANSWLKRSDQFPMAKTESELDAIRIMMKPIQDAAAFINSHT